VLYSGGDDLTGMVGGTVPGYIAKRVRGTACSCSCQSIKWLDRGSRYGGGVPAGASSEADLARGGVQPSSEAKPRPRGRLALERGGVLLARCCGPRAKRSFVRGCLGQLFWWAVGATGVAIMLCVFWACEFFVFVFFTRESVLSPVL
jgi:hypothetical protein